MVSLDSFCWVAQEEGRREGEIKADLRLPSFLLPISSLPPPFPFLLDANASAEAEVTTFKFKDGTTQTIKLEEWSALNHSVSYSIIASEPSLTFTSVVSTITVRTYSPFSRQGR